MGHITTLAENPSNLEVIIGLLILVLIDYAAQQGMATSNALPHLSVEIQKIFLK